MPRIGVVFAVFKKKISVLQFFLSGVKILRLGHTKRKKEKMTMQYVCKICGYIYDETQGDPDNGVAENTPWENVPQDWTCPLCGVGKEDFESLK